MNRTDLNLLIALDALLSEGSVTGAARRLGLSPSATSRALARLRKTTGDPLLVRAGSRLVPTPHALALQARVRNVVEESRALLHPVGELDLRQLERTFTIETREGFVDTFGPALLSRIAEEAPGVRLHFLRRRLSGSDVLRRGDVAFSTGVVKPGMEPELRTRPLFRDRFVGVVRPDHPLVFTECTPTAYADHAHVEVYQPARGRGPLQRALDSAGLVRNIATVVEGFATAIALARTTDLIATVPEWHTVAARSGMYTFPLPFEQEEITVSLLWHPRMGADPAHRWMKAVMLSTCRQYVSAVRAALPPLHDEL